jgi:nuclease S1
VKSRRLMVSVFMFVLVMLPSPMLTRPAFAWGDEGHKVIGLIATHFLDPDVLAKVNQILAADGTHLTAKDIASEATWADKYRDSDRHTPHPVHYTKTHDWHFVDLEISSPDLSAACFGRPPLPTGTKATSGPAHDCVVDKIEQFAAELGNPSTSALERRRALQFLLHFVGDIHQPLHASDDQDKGGNDKHVSGGGIPANNLHHDWDTEFVKKLGPDPQTIAQTLIADISSSNQSHWSSGTADDWAMESFKVSKEHTYGKLPAPSSAGTYSLTPSYVDDATTVVGEQLSKAGVRLAFVLNEALK